MKSFDCPHCGEGCDRDSVDVGVGVIYGPWGCPNCGWSSDPQYNSRGGVRPDGDERVFDQYGNSCHISRPGGLAILAELNVSKRGGTST